MYIWQSYLEREFTPVQSYARTLQSKLPHLLDDCGAITPSELQKPVANFKTN